MRCNRMDSLIDGLIDGELDEATAREAHRHVAVCPDCRATHEQEQSMRAALRRLPVLGPDPEFFERALTRARLENERAERPKHRTRSIRAAVAATLLIVAAGVLVTSLVRTPSSTLPEVTLALETTTSINLVFSAAEDLHGARMSLELPAGLEVAGYSGRRMLHWSTDLRRGNNVLTLPLVANAHPNDEIIARLEHANETKTFRLKVRVV